MDVSTTTRPLPNIVTGSSSGTFNTGSTTFVTVCSVTTTATGRPIALSLQHDGSGSPVSFGVFGNGVTNSVGDIQMLRGATQIAQSPIGILATNYTLHLPGSANMIDTTPGTGSVTYTFKVQVQSGGTFNAKQLVLVAVEL